MTERTLVEAAQAGLPEATDELIERYYARVYSFIAMQRTGDPEDLTQEVFARALGALSRFNGEYQFGAWLIQIARNVCIDEARRQSHRPQPTDPVDLVELEPTHAQPDDVWESVSSQIAVGTVHRALARLPQRQRTVLVLREFEGMSYADIAIALRISTRAVEISLSRARKRMRLELKRLELAEGELAACRRTATLLASDPAALNREEVAEHVRQCIVCQTLVGRRRPRNTMHAAWGFLAAGFTGLAGLLRRPASLAQALINSSAGTSVSPFSRLAEVGASLAMATAVSAGTLGAAPAPSAAIPPATPIVVPSDQTPIPVPVAPAAPAPAPPGASGSASRVPAAPQSSANSTVVPCALAKLGQLGSAQPAAAPAGSGLLGTGPLLSELLTPLTSLSPVLACDPSLAGVAGTVTNLTQGLQSAVTNGGTTSGAPAAQAPAGPSQLLNQLLGAGAPAHG